MKTTTLISTHSGVSTWEVNGKQVQALTLANAVANFHKRNPRETKIKTVKKL